MAKTLNQLLDCVEEYITDEYGVVLVNSEGIVLSIYRNPSRMLDFFVRRPDNTYESTCDILDNEQWRETLSKGLHLDLDKPDWRVHEQTFTNLEELIKIVRSIIDFWRSV